MDLILNDKHEYTLNGRRVPGVTEVIRHFVPAWSCDKFFLDKGTAVHRAVELSLAGKLERASLDPRIVGRVDAILRFVADVGLTPIKLEARVASPLLQFAGTIDCVGSLKTGRRIICDWKGSVDVGAELQLALYRLLWNEAYYYEASWAVAVECHDDGTYRCRWSKEHELQNAANVGKAMLSVYGWKMKNGLIKKDESSSETNCSKSTKSAQA